MLLAVPETVPSLRVPLAPVIGLFDGSAPLISELQIVNKDREFGRPPRAEVCLAHGDSIVWCDVVPGTVVAAVGSALCSAVGTLDGHLIIYSAAGRRLAPPLRVGPGITMLAAGSGTRLLVVSNTGRVKLLDVSTMNEVMEAPLEPLLEGGSAGLLDVRLSKEGLPIVLLTDASAYIWHRHLRAWMKVADEILGMSPFAPLPGAGSIDLGELASVQSEALMAKDPGHGVPRPVAGGPAEAAAQQHIARGVIEGNLAAAEAMASPEEYRSWLTTYTRLLAESRDEVRLRELCDSLLGGPIRQPSADNILGMEKGGLLRDVVLREMARHRTMGPLLQRCRLALDDLEAATARTKV